MKLIYLPIVVCLLFGAVGCSNTTEGAKKDIEQGSENASERMKEGMDSASNMAKEAGNSAKELGADVEAATVLTTRVKTAITADKELNDSKNMIDVDSNKETVTLKGHVATNELKAKAEKVAKEEMAKVKATQTLKNDLLVQKM
jgi:osmotically-inducible protein OsmY